MGGDVKKLTIFSFKQVCEWELCLKSRQHGPGTKQGGRPQSVSVVSVWDGSVTDGGGVQSRTSVCVCVDQTAEDLDLRSVVKMLLIYFGNRCGMKNQ